MRPGKTVKFLDKGNFANTVKFFESHITCFPAIIMVTHIKGTKRNQTICTDLEKEDVIRLHKFLDQALSHWGPFNEDVRSK
jgi:hypothetical protein